jgi:hypothetical protein
MREAHVLHNTIPSASAAGASKRECRDQTHFQKKDKKCRKTDIELSYIFFYTFLYTADEIVVREGLVYQERNAL